MNTTRFRYLHLSIFILNIVIVANIILQMTLSKHDNGSGSFFIQGSLFLLIFSCSFYFYTKALIESNKKFSKIGFTLFLLILVLTLISLYYFETWIFIILFFTPVLAALYFYVQLSIFFSFFRNNKT